MEQKTKIILIGILVIAILALGIFWFMNNNSKSNTNINNNQNLPPQEAISACNNKAAGDSCTFESKDGTLTGTCDTKPGVMACAPTNNNNAGQNKGNASTPNSKDQGKTSSTSLYGDYTNTTAYQSGYNIEQAISDKAQLNTLAFGGLGFLTGNICSDSFLPPGKVADFFGFQYLRDITAEGNGHNTDFVTNSANNILYILNDAQKAKMLALAKSQSSSVNEFAYNRYPLMEAFRRQLIGDIPSGTSSLNKAAVMSYSASLYELDANISLERAELYAEIINSLNNSQRAYLDNMVSGGFASWPALPMSDYLKGLERSESVLVMTYASEMFGWYGGDVNADTYFCPERQADYFGGFYIKDAPAIGNAGYTIDESITGDAGEAFIAALDSTQQPIVTGLVEQQRTDINGIVEKRREISAELRNALTGGTIDESRVRALAREYGALDGEIAYYYATAFSKVGATLTAAQKEKLIEIKNIEGYTCPDTSIYLYSEKITKPTIPNTDFLFA